ncbi:uncharacterized protein LOC117108191 [Anneissia japonica]|uniref:uncharacterized protein LOC117108191 n=1 Tax=Anneissia japonica TaxID=1529436 RepID=UPI0014254E95|nr:uncharacterized protein LOC117108191 [Anneissia japonica]
MQVNKESLEVKKDEKQTVSVYVTPTDFLPDAVYNILVVAFLDLMKVKGKSSEAELYQNCSDFDLDDDHLVSLGAVKIENRHALKLEISHLIDQDGNVVAEPHPSFCIEILDYLRDQLKTVYGTTEGIGYKLRVLCSACQPTQKPHLHDLEDCLKKKIRCGRKAMNTSRLKRLFSAESSESTDASSKTLQPVPPEKVYPDRLISESELNTFSGKLGADWKSFVRSLGLKDNEIFHACPVYSPEREKIFCCLLKWRDLEAGNATVKALVEKCTEHQIDVDVYEFLLE